MFFAAENIWNLTKLVLENWEILELVIVALRDGAQNMIKAFENCDIIDLHCLIHALMLVINSGLLNMKSVKTMVIAVREIVSHANMSNNFYAELYRSEKLFQK